MLYSQKDLQEFLKSYKLPIPTTEMTNALQTHLEPLKAIAQGTNESEEHQKNLIADFLKSIFATSQINTKGRIDLAIFENDEVKTFFEVKSINNKSEFPKSPNTLDSKAFYESLLYYMRERKEGNNNLKFIFLCNIEAFYLIPAKEFEKLYQNKDLKKAYENVDSKKGNDTSTEAFYKAAQKILDTLDLEITFTYFNIQDTDIALLYQVFSIDLLLDRQKHFDSNVLNQNFYEELLYILGLEETKEGGNKLIKLSSTPNTLSYAIRENLNLDSSQDFEKIFSLITLWNNRILFLRLLESMLISFKHFDKPFLNSSDIKDFKTLNTLFFEVLAIKEKDRIQTLPKALSPIPYLNSSLFDKSELEKQGKEIKLLDSKPLELYKKSILKDTQDSLPLLDYLFRFLNAYNFTTTPKDIQDNIKINHDKLINSAVLGLVFEKLNGYKEGSFYTPSFITSYMCKESITKAIIRKYNTTFNWNARELRDIANLAREHNISKKDLLTTLLSLKICDPAVGSGHFLVSALNEMVLVAYKIGLLDSFDMRTILELESDEIIIWQNEKVFSYQKPKNSNEPQHQIQKELFHLKKDIIESCLFGVDINPNSCEITKLRLWIELLKYSYYKFDDTQNTNTLQTLPNIDINIKCGNSLISYFDITQSLSHYKNIKQKIENYKTSVSNYKQGFYTSKSDIDKEIKSLKEAFKNFCFNDKFAKEIKSFEDKCDSYSKKYGNYLAKDDKNLAIYVKAGFFLEFDEKQAQNDFKKLQDSYNALFNLESNNPFEWRFEFPEVLDESGDFKGFDLIIGNPPYIRQEDIKELKPFLSKAYQVYKGTSDIYTYFFELGHKVLKDNGILSFITSNKYTRAGYGESLRDFILANTTILNYIDLNGIKVFDSATVDTSIITFQKDRAKADASFYYLAPKEIKENSLYESSSQKLKQSSLSKEGFHFSDEATQELKAKIEQIGTPLKEWNVSIYRGILTGYNEAFVIDSAKREEILKSCKNEDEKARTDKLIKKMLRGRDIKRYSYEWADLWLINTHNGYKDSKGNEIPPIDINEYPVLKAYFDEIGKNHKGKGKGLFDRDDKGITPYNLRNCAYLEDFEKEKISWQRVTQEPSFILEKEYILLDSMAFLVGDSKKVLAYLLGFLNSKLIFYYFKNIGHLYSDKGFLLSNQYVEKFPIPKIDSTNKALSDEIISLVEQILDSKAKDPTTDTKDLESKIDNLVYTLYNLNEDEIKIIEGK